MWCTKVLPTYFLKKYIVAEMRKKKFITKIDHRVHVLSQNEKNTFYNERIIIIRFLNDLF